MGHIKFNYSDLSRGQLKWWFSKGIPPKCPKNSGLGIIVSCPHISSISLKCQIGVAGITWGGGLLKPWFTVGLARERVPKRCLSTQNTSQGMTGALGFFWFSGWWFRSCLIFIPTWERFSILTHIFQMGWNHHLVLYEGKPAFKLPQVPLVFQCLRKA